MKYLIATLILLSIGLSNATYAVEKPKKNSFGDKDHKYRSQYSKSSHKPKIVSPATNGKNSSSEAPKPENPQDKPKEWHYVGH